MDFGALPPEINSVRMYTGPGSGSMMAAAEAWQGLAAELNSAAASYGSVVSGLTNESWLGPSSAAMAAAAAPYVAWMSATAAQAAQAATQAGAAAGAYETAFAATVPPPLVAANRSELASLVSTNIVGQNTAAIAANEAQYGEMWAQDSAAMYSYASSSAAATTVTPFTAPAAATDPSGVLAQLVAALEAGVTSFVSSIQTQLSQLFTAVPTALQSLGTIATSSNPLQGLLSTLTSLTGSQSSISSIMAYVETIPKLMLPANDAMITAIFGVAMGTKMLASAPVAAAGAGSTLAAGLHSGTAAVASAGSTGVGAAGSAVSAGVGHAGMVGKLSVPPSWASATPAVRLIAATLPGTSIAAAPTVAAASGLFSQMGLASLVGGALGAGAPNASSGTAARGARLTSSKDAPTPDQLKRLVAELSKKPGAVQHWHTGSAQLEGLIAELSKKPGIHTVHLSGGNKANPKPPNSQSG